MSDILLPPIEISPPQASFIASTTSRNLLHCGQGTGKTHIEGIISAMFIKDVPDVIGLIGANTYSQLSDSTLFRIFQVWKQYFGWTEWTTQNQSGFYTIGRKPPSTFKAHGYTFQSNHNKIFFRNGAVVMTVSLDNYTALDGREIGWAVLDETKDTAEEALKEVITRRLRASGIYLKKDYTFENDFFPYCNKNNPRADAQANPLYIFTSPAKEQWLSEMFNLDSYKEEIERTIFDTLPPYDYFVSRTDFQTVVIASSYHNKHNLPSDYIDSAFRDLSKDRADMLVFGSPFGKSGVEYYSKFNRTTHVGNVNWVPGYPLHVTFDFNANPYMTMLVLQLVPNGNRWQANILKEYCLASPLNSIEAVCKAFLDDFLQESYVGLYYYGDASGKNTLPIEEVRNFYKVVESSLDQVLMHDSRRLLKKNLNHRSAAKGTMGRRDFMNKMLSGSLNVDMVIDQSCKHTIADFEFVKEDSNGAKLKKKETINGVSSEKYGHTSDAVDAFFCYLFYEGA